MALTFCNRNLSINLSTEATNLLSQEDINQTAYLGTHIIQFYSTIKVELCMYVTMLIAVPHYPDMIMAFVLSQTKSDLHLKNLRGKKSRKFNRKQSLPCLPIFYSSRKEKSLFFNN